MGKIKSFTKYDWKEGDILLCINDFTIHQVVSLTPVKKYKLLTHVWDSPPREDDIYQPQKNEIFIQIDIPERFLQCNKKFSDVINLMMESVENDTAE